MRETLSSLLDRASALELQVADIYDNLAARFESNPELSQFWVLFAEAERYHSLIIQMQKLGMTQATADSDQVKAWGVEIGETQTYLGEILTRLAEGKWNPSISEAFEMAQDIEGRSLEVQARSFALFESPVIKELVTRLHQEDVQHRSKLIEAQERFSRAS